VSLKPEVVLSLARHGIAAGPEDLPAALRERLNDAYLEDVRALKQKQVSGEIPRREYAGHVLALKESYPLLGLPIELWAD
jgi:hypothetical protein